MQHRKTKIVSWGLALVGVCGLGLLGTSCSSETDGSAERAPTVADFDLTSVPTNSVELEAAVAEWDKAYDVGRTHPAVLARKEQLVKINDVLANMVESVEIEPGHVVKFYEPQPGARMVTETFLDNQKRALQGVALTSFADVYRALRPTATPPVALAEVDERAADTALQSAPPADLGQATAEPQVTPEPEAIDKHATSSCSHFMNDHGGCPAGSTGDTPFCRCNVGSVPQAAAAASKHSAWLVAPYVGGVSFRFTYSGTVQSTVPIAQGEHYGIQWTSGSGQGSHPSCNGCTWAGCNNYQWCTREHRGDVINVTTGEQYHFGGCLEYDNPTWECI